MKKSKLFAPFLMLLAGAVVSIMMYYFKYGIQQTLPVLLIVLLVFYLAGVFIQKKVTSFVEQIKEKEEKEKEVMEKEVSEEDKEEMADENAEIETEGEV